MSVTSVQSPTTPTATTTSTAASPAVNQQTFLKLLMAQLQNQDPLNPTDSTQFVTQLSQFSLVEQSVNQTQQLSNMSQQLTGISNGNASNLVGKTVTISNGGGAVSFDGVTATTSNVTLPNAATKVSATITDASGNVVRTIDLGSRPAGALNVVWDGKDNNGQPEPKGSYTVAVQATASDGSNVAVSQYTTGVVQSVSYDKGYPDLLLTNGVDAPIANLVSVGTTPSK